MTILTTLALSVLLAAPADPCSSLPATQLAMIFAEAGEPVTLEEATGFGAAQQQGFCRYAFTDESGRGINVEVNVRPHAGSERFTACADGGDVGELRQLPDVADEACTWYGGSATPLMTVSFRSGGRVGVVGIDWGHAVAETSPRWEIAETIARAWIGAISAPPAAGSAPVDESLVAGIVHYVSAQAEVFGLARSRAVLVRQPGESIDTWARRMDADSRVKATLARHDFTPLAYLRFGVRFHDAWMAHIGEPTGNPPDAAMLAAIHAGGDLIAGLVDRSWPGLR